MHKLIFVLFTGIFVCLWAAAQNSSRSTQKMPRSVQRSRKSGDWRAIHQSALIIDTHADTPQRFLDEAFDIAAVTPTSEGMFDLSKVHAGNLGAEFFSIWVDPVAYKGRYAHRALDLVDSVYEQVAKHPGQMVMAFSAEDIVRAHTGPKPRLASLMGIEGGHVIENDLRLLREFYRLGVRYMTLTHSNTNEWADASGDLDKKDVEHHNGLTDFGKQVVREMNRLGMMVDVSHVSDKTFYDTLVISRAPVIASHSSARALCDAPRNLTDDMLRAVARNGGVVDVNFWSGFVDETYRRAYAAQKDDRDKAIAALQEKYKNSDPTTRYRELDRAQKEWAAKIPRPAFKSLIDQIDHIAKVAGVDHVGIGSDFDGIPALPAGIDSVADLPKITEALVARGYSQEQIDKILGGNLLRVFRDVERISHELHKEKPLGPNPLYGPELSK